MSSALGAHNESRSYSLGASESSGILLRPSTAEISFRMQQELEERMFF